MVRHEHHHNRFPAHTRLKHLILDAYVVAWAMKLIQWGRAGRRVAIVDAFAGRGQDSEGTPGSALIVGQRALEVTSVLSARGASVQLFAIEADPENCEALRQAVAPLNAGRERLVEVRKGQLAEHLGEIRSRVGLAPAFYFLDPYGVKGLDAGTYAPALEGPHNEIFALFSDLGACRLYGLLTAERRDSEREREAILARPSLFPDMDEMEAERAAAGAEAANNALDASVPASRTHLTRALGNEQWVDTLATTPPAQRADRFVELFREAMIAAGARFVLSLPMRNENGRRVYSLVHAARSAAAFVTMKECISTGLNKTSLRGTIVQRMREDLSVDLPHLISQLRRRFAGESVPWAGNDGLRERLLRETPLFHFQCDALKRQLKDAVILQRIDRKEICVFPITTDEQQPSPVRAANPSAQGEP